jgi:DNA-binding CsgD family transcriptional regulator
VSSSGSARRPGSEKARAELGRIGGRTREEGLTAAERRVAALVAEGRTNKEVAAALLLGERTVETHLSHVYAKLGVRSRAELARRFPAGRAKLRGTHDFKLSTAAYRRSGAELPRRDVPRRHREIEIGPARRCSLGRSCSPAPARCRRTAADAVRARRQYPAATTPVAFWSTEARCAIVPAGPGGIFGSENFGNKFPGEAAVYMGIVHVAIYDAAVALDGGYRPYLPTPAAPANTSPEAAIATAAYDTLTGLQPPLGADQAILDDDYAAYMAAIPDGTVWRGRPSGMGSRSASRSRRRSSR